MEIPEGWKDGTLGNLVKLKRGHDLPSKVRLPGDIEVVGGGGPNGYHNTAKAPAPGIVIGRSGSGIGNAFWSDKPFWPLNTGLYVTDYIGNHPEFCFLWLDWMDFKRHNTGGAQPSLNRNYIYPIPVPIPPLAEQERIAMIVNSWDRAIAATEALITASEAQKKALMQQLLTGKRRLPGFDGEWQEVRLGDLGAISSAGVDKKKVDGEKTVRLLNFLDAYNREFINDGDINHEVTAPDRKIIQCDVRKGDVFLTPSSETRSDIGIAAVAREDMPGVCYSYHVVRFRPEDFLHPDFAAYAFQTDHYKRQAYRLGDGSGQRYVISQGGFRSITLMVPDVDEQKAIAEILVDCSTQITALQSKLQTLKTEKAALMQQLLTGKRRVKLTENAA